MSDLEEVIKLVTRVYIGGFLAVIVTTALIAIAIGIAIGGAL